MIDNDNPTTRPTAEAIDAALSAYEFIADEKTGELSDETKAFGNLMLGNERLKMEFLGLCNAIGCPPGFDPMDWQGLAKAGHVDAELMMKVMLLCDMFFWVGWNSRGAMNEADELRKLVQP